MAKPATSSITSCGTTWTGRSGGSWSRRSASRRAWRSESSSASSRCPAPAKPVRARNYDEAAELVAEKVAKTFGKISAKRLLPAARAAGYEGSDRNFRRLVATAKREWRHGQARASGRRPAIWSPGEVLAIDWGEEVVAGRKVHVFCAVLAWSRFRFVRFAADEQQATTLGMLAECFEVLGGVPKVVLADRMGCLKGGVVANVVVRAPDYVRFATHYRFRPDFCHAQDPESKGIVENLVGYAKDDLLVPLELDDDPWVGALAGLNERAVSWCGEVNTAVHSEIHAVPEQRLATEAELLSELPSLRLEVGPKPISRKVDKLSCIRFGSARYSGAEPAHRHSRHGAGRRTRPCPTSDRADHRGGPRRTLVGRARRGQYRRCPLRPATAGRSEPGGARSHHRRA